MSPGSNIRKLDSILPSGDVIREAAEIIRRGGVVVFPTTGLYGLAADAENPAAVDRIFLIKKRPPDKPILLLIPHVSAVRNLVREISPAAERIMAAFWPGSLTLVFEAAAGLLPALTAGTGKIGIRLPAFPAARHLVQAAGRPITATSANISGQAGCASIADLDPAVAASADLILDAGPLKGGAGSTVLDVTRNPPVFIREGTVPRERILDLLKL